MGPVNWGATVLAAAVAAALGWGWYRRLGAGKAPPLLVLALLLIPASLIAHNFARVGAGVLGAKPWLYLMMSGGFALTMVLPALAISHARHGLSRRDYALDAGFFIAAYLLIGAVFYAAG